MGTERRRLGSRLTLRPAMEPGERRNGVRRGQGSLDFCSSWPMFAPRAEGAGAHDRAIAFARQFFGEFDEIELDPYPYRPPDRLRGFST
jgi:hypothetical protein